MRKLCSLFFVIILIASLPVCVFADFDYSVFSNLPTYKYNKFDKQWSYYEPYIEEYADGYIIIGMKIIGQKEKSDPDIIELYVKAVDKSYNNMYDVTGITFLINDKMYSYDSMYQGGGEGSVVLGKLAEPLIVALSKANDVSARVYAGNNYWDIDLKQSEFNNTLKSFCKKMLNYGVLEYLDYSANGHFAAVFEELYPLTIDGEKVVKKEETSSTPATSFFDMFKKR